MERRPFWKSLFGYNWRFGLALILLVCIPRFFLVLAANRTSNYQYIGIVMLISGLAPFLFLTKAGQQQIGIVRTKKLGTLALAFLGGILASLALHYLGQSLYSGGVENWFSYIGRSYPSTVGLSAENKWITFCIVAGTGMVFSPIGEEFFFRGLVHQSLRNSWGSTWASHLDALAFALTHLSHFGLIYWVGSWKFLPLPAFLWVSSMYLLSLYFSRCKEKAGSIWGAVLGHSGFNLGMTYSIFYLL